MDKIKIFTLPKKDLKQGRMAYVKFNIILKKKIN
jgi:hypothetical protein